MPDNPKKLCVGFLFDDTLDSTDGVAQHVKTLGGWLSASGHQVVYIVGETKLKSWRGGKVYSLAKNQAVYFNGNKLSIPMLARKKDIKSVFKEYDFDVLHVMMPHSPLMSQRVINMAPSKTAIVGTFHIYPSGWLSITGSRLLKLIYLRGLKRFSAVVSVSSAAAGFAKRAYGINSQVIPNPVDIEAYKSPAHKPNKRPTIVFLGRLVKRKGCRQLLEAFVELLKELPEAKLIVGGDGPQKPQLQRLSSRLGISNSVEFRGFINETDKPALLSSADIACFPSLYGESFGIVLIEAMAAGAGVTIGGNNPGYASILGSQPELLIDPRDKSAFSSRLKALLTDKKKNRHLHEWEQMQVKQYDINAVGPKIVNVYLDAIARLRKTRHNKAHE